MRKKYKEQLPLMGHTINHPHTVEMELIGKILEKTSIIYKMALQDLTREVKSKETGANGMSAEQVVKAAVVPIYPLFILCRYPVALRQGSSLVKF